MASILRRPEHIDVIGYMERWVRWSERGVRFTAKVPCLTGRMMAGMLLTKCPTCLGRYRTDRSRFTGIEGNKIGSDLPWVEPCPACNGAGKVTGLDAVRHTKTVKCTFCLGVDPLTGKTVPTGLIFGRTCFKCGGRKVRQLIHERVNPASIHGTRHSGQNEDEDPISMLIDRTVAGWEFEDGKHWMHIVVLMEYRVHATQKDKARHRGISQGYYSKNLSRAHSEIESLLLTALDAGII